MIDRGRGGIDTCYPHRVAQLTPGSDLLIKRGLFPTDVSASPCGHQTLGTLRQAIKAVQPEGASSKGQMTWIVKVNKGHAV